jgi:hypothetical protein
MSNEQDKYGIVRTMEPIPVATSGPFVAITPNVTATPDPAVSRAFYDTVAKDLERRRQSGGSSY